MVKSKVGEVTLTQKIINDIGLLLANEGSKPVLLRILATLEGELKEKSSKTAGAFVLNNDQVTRGIALKLQGQQEIIRDIILILNNYHTVKTRHK